MSAYTDTILPPRHDRALPLWAVAALIVLALHIGLGLYFILTHRIDLASGAPEDTVMIDLAPIATAPSQASQAAPPEPQPPQEKPPELTQPEPPPPPPTPAPEIPKTPEVPQAEAVLPPPPPPKPIEDKHKEIEKQKIEREKLRKEPAEKARAAAASRASRASRASGPAPGASGMSLSEWQSLVQARVNAAAPAAHEGGESGSVRLAFTVDAGGGVGGARLAGSTGSATLDREALAIAHRLGHLPPPPNGRVTVSVSVHFR